MSDPVKERSADLSALVNQFQSGKLTLVEVVCEAYGMGHDDATAAWNRANEVIAKALNVILPKDKP